jgi:hypothetical protein
MKRKSTALMLSILVALSLALPVAAKPNMYLEMQCKITGIGLPTQENTFDVMFEGVAAGPEIIAGKVEGVDHVYIDADDVTHLNVFYTVTDKDGSKVSVNVDGTSVEKNPGRQVFVDATATVINTEDYPTTGKFEYLYEAETVFKDEGFLTAIKFDPVSFSLSGRIHAKWFWE